jgi:hypothetical protein
MTDQLRGRTITAAHRFIAEDDLVVVEDVGATHHGRDALPQRVLLGLPP